MALKATILKANLSIADMDRHHYQDYQLTIAQHPSETDRRVMLRLLAFATLADDNLQFCKGLSTDDEPDLWQLHDNGTIERWVELGTPDPKRLKKACHKAKQVYLFCYGDNAVTVWWSQHRQAVESLRNLTILQIRDDELDGLAQLVQRSMNLAMTQQESQWMITDQEATATVELTALQSNH
ncbi:YaeQ family protein [Neiella sp. HB171785]|uniref:YaeQ family protein n=1 Tax=Neiella litorisoli TaxID=2771431 RepID=A0A8J6QMM4_9GAMM|nr:YaeQ family protein [Neiella litorisoli]MBD1391257.1 YaeQ family protein [Neiella litorisoli]